MKKGIKILTLVALCVATVACSSPKKMAELAESVTVTSDPSPLEVVAGQINANVSVTFPADYFLPKAILEVTPVLVYEGGEVAMSPYYFQGEKVTDNYQVVSTSGGKVTKTVHFEYVEGMEKSYLELRSVASVKTKSVDLPVKKVADGANTTYMLVDRKGRVELRPDGYQEIIYQTAEGQILYTINSSDVRNTELKSQSVKDFLASVDEIKANERKVITGTDIVAYASPDGGEELNTKLSNKRSTTAETAFNKVTKGNEIDAPVNVQSIGQDWEGFQELVGESNIDDKDLILRVLSMYSDPAVRENEIKNMSAVYKELAKEILPELRRARFIANVEYTNYTNEELVQLLEDNVDILDETALLRAATLVKGLDAKVAIYQRAIEKYDSDAAMFNLAAVYLNAGKTEEGEKALAKVSEKDAEYQNAQGVVALQKEDYDTAVKCFTAAKTATANENLGIIDILSGKYSDAASKLANCKGLNKPLSLILVNDLSGASAALEGKDNAKASYLKAIVAARQGNADAVKTNCEAAAKVQFFADRAAKDIEFAQFK